MPTRPELERRRLQRVELQGQIQGRYSNGGVHEVTGVSKNVSAEGMFVLLDTALSEGAHVELVLKLPSDHVFRQPITMRCAGKVVRTEGPASDGRYGVAVLFDEVEIVSGN